MFFWFKKRMIIRLFGTNLLKIICLLKFSQYEHVQNVAFYTFLKKNILTRASPSDLEKLASPHDSNSTVCVCSSGGAPLITITTSKLQKTTTISRQFRSQPIPNTHYRPQHHHKPSIAVHTIQMMEILRCAFSIFPGRLTFEYSCCGGRRKSKNPPPSLQRKCSGFQRTGIDYGGLRDFWWCLCSKRSSLTPFFAIAEAEHGAGKWNFQLNEYFEILIYGNSPGNFLESPGGQVCVLSHLPESTTNGAGAEFGSRVVTTWLC